MAPGTHHVRDRGLNVGLQFIRDCFHPRSRGYNGTSREGFIPSRFELPPPACLPWHVAGQGYTLGQADGIGPAEASIPLRAPGIEPFPSLGIPAGQGSCKDRRYVLDLIHPFQVKPDGNV